MAQSQIRQPSQEELLRALTAGQGTFDPTVASKGVIAGEDLASTILKNKQGQEDRVRQLAEKIAQAKKEATFVKGVQAGPTVTNIIGKPVTASQTIQGVQPEDKQLGDIANAFPKETAMDLLKERLQATSEEGKTKRALLKQQQKNEAPDKIKQLFQVGDKVMGVTYGGLVKEINAPGQLNPLKKTLPADASTQLADFDTLSSQIQTVKDTFNKDFTGPVQARTGELAQTLDMPSIGLGADAKRSDFYSNVNSIRNQLLYLRSGKQINEKEYERLLAELPNEKRSDVDFSAKLKNFENVFNEIKNNRRSALATGYNIPGSSTPPPAAGNPGKTSGFRVISVRPSGSK
jgi:hypothetical protein